MDLVAAAPPVLDGDDGASISMVVFDLMVSWIFTVALLKILCEESACPMARLASHEMVSVSKENKQLCSIII